MIVNHLFHATDAPFDSERHKARGVRECLEKTRTDVLQRIQEWFTGVDESQSPVFWLNGMAGLGKSTIAYSISQWAKAEGVLKGSFFFNRDEPDLRDYTLVLPTLSHQLAHLDYGFRKALAVTLTKNSDCHRKTASEQFSLLIRGPLNAANQIAPNKPFLIVIDAVDECTSEEGIKEVLGILLDGIKNAPRPFRIFITGRPDTAIEQFFREKKYEGVVLQEIEKSIVQLDIKAYLLDGFTHPPPSQAALLPPGWPTDEDFASLLEDCGELFVYAATALRFIFDNDARTGKPKDRLRILLENRDNTKSFNKLDKLYLDILNNIIYSLKTSGLADQEANITRNLFETIVLLPNPLPSYYFFRFLGIDEDIIRAGLDRLHSIMVIPEFNSMKESPRFYHKSFSDFIADPKRCTDKKFVVDRDDPDSDGRMCSRCLDTMMRCLSGDTLTTDSTKRSDTNTGSQTDDQRPRETMITWPFPPDFRYAYSSWVTHLLRARKGDPLVVDRLSKFVKGYLLFWLEAVSYLGMVEDAERDMRKVYDWSVSWF